MYLLAGWLEEWVRFDDMLATVLARPAERSADRVAQWRQLLDLIAQRRPGADLDLAREAFSRLQAMRGDIPVEVRQETARTFAGRPISPMLVAFLAADVPGVAGAILPHARLEEDGWLSILPRLSPTGRGFLRHRSDLGARVTAALAVFGAADLALQGEADVTRPLPTTKAPPVDPLDLLGVPPVQALEHGAGEGQIRAIISRIARFRQGREAGAPETAPEPIKAFRFETGADGIIRWVEGVSRGPLVGETIAVPASGPYGVDAQAPGAFRQRAPFRHARLRVAGLSEAAGEWRIAGVPVFSTVNGHFEGYRCVARRPEEHERADSPSEPGLGIAPDSLRQLVHELRTPLNAIGGFAEMIRRQMRGPVSAAYRERAQSIAEQAGQLLAAVDDLDVAARLETRRLDLQHLPIDLGPMLDAVCGNHAEGAHQRGVLLESGIGSGLPQVMGDPAAMRRMLRRLVGAAVALAGEGEAIRVTLVPVAGSQHLDLAVTRPVRLAGQEEAVLLDPGYGPRGDSPDAPLLGLGFSLHLVRRLAATIGGELRVEEGRFLLRLPVAGDASVAAGA